MLRYNPDKAPNPKEWLAEDESLRIAAVKRYHRKHGNFGQSLQSHASFHTIVENQLAEGFEPVQKAFARLQKEGLTRHEAVHAVASVLAEHIFNLQKGRLAHLEDPNQEYFRTLSEYTAQAWYASGES